ncbi:WecB/TagA/CpsF family glycosyltransferase [Pseudohongiella sp. O18]|uniref:WecB/TagA/CpsF family glycosyltransferase n=1 Tax=Pseudohongiella sp. O18 TaxID=2904248 RepID=UPI001F2BE780|nr:WecB/TagA/CpsF family glycosyltransferase [Pseudohongiella sp. O18]
MKEHRLEASSCTARSIVAGVNFTVIDSERLTLFKRSVGVSGQRVCVLNARALYHATQNVHYRDLVNSADIVVPDGMPIFRILKWRGFTNMVRIRGIDIFNHLLTDSEVSKKRHLFLGTNASTLDKLRNALQEAGRLPALSMFEPLPYGSEDEIKRTMNLQRLKNFDPEVVWVSLGAPKQDNIGAFLSSELALSTVVGVGLVFDYVAGNVRKPPEFVARYGFEWLFRIFTQTKRAKYFIKPFFFILREMIYEAFTKLFGRAHN